MAASTTVLVIGGGGREHALAWSLAASPSTRIVVSPGNAGLAAQGFETVPYTTVADAVSLAQSLGPASLVVVGPEAPLADGIADALAAVGVPCFGPSRASARLESSKAFSKAFMARHGIPTAAHASFTSFPEAEAYIRGAGHRVVVKASGLAAGKGVVVAAGVEDAVAAAREMLEVRSFGDAGREVVVEEFVEGWEASVLAFCDGKTAVALPPAQDHKRAHEFDSGGLTGGMGAFAPAAAFDAELQARALREALQPVLDGCAAEGHPFVGVLFAGLMVRPDRSLCVLEYNCRFGDPEAQVLLPLLDTPLLDVLRACVQGRLGSTPVRTKAGVVAATVVVAAGGYPGAYARGVPITLGPRAGAGGVPPAGALTPSSRAGSFVFHAGTGRDAATGALVTSGGRVLAVTSLGPSLRGALAASYGVCEDVAFPGAFWRRDLGGGYTRPRAAQEPLRVGVLGSTRGSSLAPVLAAIADGRLCGVRVSVVVSNKADAGILDKARDAGIPAEHVPSQGRDREAFERDVIRVLTAHDVDVVLLVGFMRILSPAFVDRFAHRTLNVHPSLLPLHAGGMDLEVHAAVLAAGEARSGCTVHLVDSHVDGGFVLVQRACAVLPGDTPAALKARVQALEGDALAYALHLFSDDAPLDLLLSLRRAGGKWEAIASQLPRERLPSAEALAATGGARLTYAAAGVDIDAGDALVQNIKPLAKSTARPGADADLGGFGGVFDLARAGYTDPLLVSGTDGVGTKLRVALIADVHDTVGIDLVAMSVNDLVVQGAEPLVFLDYFACGKLDVAQATAVVAGVAEGCRQAGCTLVGGETAEMPSMYAPGDYDLAGFAVGAVERSRILPALHRQRAGDVLLGIASSGVHSNGFSLVRRIVAAHSLDWLAPPPFSSPARRLCDALLTPTRIYIKCLLPSIKAPEGCKIIAMAHITGGGLPDNVPRVLRAGLRARIDAASWPILPVFAWMQRLGAGVEPHEMARTFNCGIGMVVVVAPEDAEAVKAAIAREGEAVYTIGRLEEHTDETQPVVVIDRLAEAFAAATC